MPLDQTRDHGTARKVDHLGVTIDKFRNVSIATYTNDGVAAHGNRLLRTQSVVHSNYIAAAQHEVGRFRWRLLI